MQIVSKSFAQNANYNELLRVQKQKSYLEEAIGELSRIDCHKLPQLPPEMADIEEVPPIFAYQQLLRRIRPLLDGLHSHSEFKKRLRPPVVAICLTTSNYPVICLVLEVFGKSGQGNRSGPNKDFKVLSITERNSGEQQRIGKLSYEYEKNSASNFQGNYSYSSGNISADSLLTVMNFQLKLPSRPNTPDYIEELARAKAEHAKGRLMEKDMVEVFKGEAVLQRSYEDLQEMRKMMVLSPCFECEKKKEHVLEEEKVLQKKTELMKVKRLIEEYQKIMKIDDYNHMVNILKQFEYIDTNNLPLLKARLGRELGSLYLTEVFVNNVLENLDPPEIAAYCSMFVQGAKAEGFYDDEDLPDNLHEAIETSRKILERVFKCEIEEEIISVQGDIECMFEQQLNLGCVKSVYEWARKRDFKDILEFTSMMEGSLIRTIRSLYQLMRKILLALRIVGNTTTEEKVKEAMDLVKRDIVSAVSLYIENPERP